MINVSIVTYNTDQNELKRCLESLDSDIVSSIYVIDNSRRNYIRDTVAQYPKTTYIPSENVGYGAGHNKALIHTLENSTIKAHLVVNSDVRFNPGILKSLADELDNNPAIGILHPMIFNSKDELQFTARALPSPFDLILRRFIPLSFFKKSRERYLLKHLDHSRTINAPNLQGSFLFISKTALEKCGTFDERYFMYPEDIDLTRRINEKYLTLYWPKVKIYHFHRQASYHSLKMLRIHIVNMIRYFNKWGWINDKKRKDANLRIDYLTTKRTP